jgi:hypothetical protein
VLALSAGFDGVSLSRGWAGGVLVGGLGHWVFS